MRESKTPTRSNHQRKNIDTAENEPNKMLVPTSQPLVRLVVTRNNPPVNTSPFIFPASLPRRTAASGTLWHFPYFRYKLQCRLPNPIFIHISKPHTFLCLGYRISVTRDVLNRTLLRNDKEHPVKHVPSAVEWEDISTQTRWGGRPLHFHYSSPVDPTLSCSRYRYFKHAEKIHAELNTLYHPFVSSIPSSCVT